MNEKVIIRKARTSDADEIAAIYNESILAVDSTMIDQPIDGEEILRQMTGFSDQETYYVMEQGNCSIGWGVIKRFGKGPAYQYTGETSVFLSRSETRKGYGTRLKKYLLDQSKALGYHHLVARIWASNTHSIEYNKRFGYEVVGIQKEIGHMNGNWVDVALLQLVFDTPHTPQFTQPPAPSPQPSYLKPYSNRGGYRYTAEISATDQANLQELVEKAGEQGYHHVLAWITQDEVEMYVATGFEVVGVQQEICIGPDGWMDIVVVQYLIVDLTALS